MVDGNKPIVSVVLYIIAAYKVEEEREGLQCTSCAYYSIQ
jgi:hypothetical protein